MLGVELLPGMEAHQGLHTVHVYKNYCTVHQPVGHLALESLRLAAVQHVDVLAGDEGWEEADIHEVLGALPGPVNSVRVWAGPFRATLGLGQDDKDQITRELHMFDWAGRDVASALKAFGAWPRGLTPAACLALVRFTHLGRSLELNQGDVETMGQLLARSDRVECDILRVKSYSVHRLVPQLQALRVLPRKVGLLIEQDSANQHWVLKLAVAPPHTASYRTTTSATTSGGGPAAGTAQQPPGQQGLGPLTTTTLGGLWERAVGLMEARERSLPAGEEGGGGGGAGVVLLRGPGVSGLAAHRTLEGWAALEAALVQLWRSRGGVEDGARRECMVLPGGSGMLLHWGGEQLAGEEAAEAIRGAVAVEARGRGVQPGSVRAVVLRHGGVEEVGEELEACVRQVLESAPLPPEDLVRQLQAAVRLWTGFIAKWRQPPVQPTTVYRGQEARFRPTVTWAVE